MGEQKRRELVFNACQLAGQEYKVDYRELLPKAPDYKPRAKWGWGCFCVFDDKDNVVDLVTIKLDGAKGYSNAHGELDYGKLQDALEMWRELSECRFLKRIVNGALLH
jgi:hypothetical protein